MVYRTYQSRGATDEEVQKGMSKQLYKVKLVYKQPYGPTWGKTTMYLEGDDLLLTTQFAVNHLIVTHAGFYRDIRAVSVKEIEGEINRNA